MLGIQAQRGWLRKVRDGEEDERRRGVHRRRWGYDPPTPTMLAGNLSGGNQQKVSWPAGWRPLRG